MNHTGYYKGIRINLKYAASQVYAYGKDDPWVVEYVLDNLKEEDIPKALKMAEEMEAEKTRLKRGDNVRFSELAEHKFPLRKNKTGVITGYGRGENLIRVKPTGKNYSQTHHANFWRINDQ